MRIAEPTRLDWTFVVASQSLGKPPAAWLGDYDSTKQTYELFVPTRKNSKAGMPVILFLSPGDDSAGWKSFEKLARSQGILFASPHGAGNNCPPKQRVRIVLDVLDDLRPQLSHRPRPHLPRRLLRRRPDRLRHRLRAAGVVRRSHADLRQRQSARRVVAATADRRAPRRCPADRRDRLQPRRGRAPRGPFLKDVGVRTRVWTQAGLGHGIPNEKTLGEAFRWLEESLPNAKRWQGSMRRVASGRPRKATARPWPRRCSPRERRAWPIRRRSITG